MVDIHSVAAEIRRGKKIDRKKDRKKLQGKNMDFMAPLLHRAAIKIEITGQKYYGPPPIT